MINRLRKEEAGFTLIELLVVVLILGILVAIAVPNFTNSADSAKTKTADANLRTASSVLAAALASGESPVYTGGVTASGTPTDCLQVTANGVTRHVDVNPSTGAISGSTASGACA